MDKSRRVSPYTDVVKTESWRNDFLKLISGIDGFDAMVHHSRSVGRPPEIDEKLMREARLVVESRNMDELTIARQYYNNAHLLVYWRMLKGDIKQGHISGNINKEFPLFQVKRDARTGGIALEGVAAEFLDKIHFDLDETTIMGFDEDQGAVQHVLPVLFKSSASNLRRQKPLNRAFMQLSLVSRVMLASFESYYSYFVAHQRAQKSSIWDYYQIHCFLDNFLYVEPGGETRRANYDAIFGNSSLFELKLYLQYCLDNNTSIHLKDVEAFLERQRKFYLSLALEITLEENEIHNWCKSLLAYNAEKGIVHAQNTSSELIEHYRKTVIESFGVVKQNGCPFAMSIGASSNALLEVFRYSDTIFLHLLHHSIDFKKVFGK